MQRLGQELLAAAGLAVDQQVDGRIDQARRALQLQLQRGIAAGQRRQGIRHLHLRFGGRRLPAQRGRQHAQVQQAAAAGQRHQALLARARIDVMAQVFQARVEQRLEPLAQHGGARCTTQLAFQHQPGAVVVADDAARLVQRQQVFGIDVDELRRHVQLQDPVAAVRAQEVGVLDMRGVDAHHLQRQPLAVLGLRRGQRGDVEDGMQVAVRVEQRRGGAGQRDMGGVEMVGLVHRQRLARGQGGADRAGAGAALAPLGAQVQARVAQRGIAAGLADIVDGHALRIGQQHHIAQARHLPIQALQAVARDAREVVDAFLVFAQARLRQDARLLHARRIQAVLVHAAAP